MRTARSGQNCATYALNFGLGGLEREEKTHSSLPLRFSRLPGQNCSTHNRKLQLGWLRGGGGDPQLAPTPLFFASRVKTARLMPKHSFLGALEQEEEKTLSSLTLLFFRLPGQKFSTYTRAESQRFVVEHRLHTKPSQASPRTHTYYYLTDLSKPLSQAQEPLSSSLGLQPLSYLILPRSAAGLVLPSSSTSPVLPGSAASLVLPQSAATFILPGSAAIVILARSPAIFILPGCPASLVLPRSPATLVLTGSPAIVASLATPVLLESAAILILARSPASLVLSRSPPILVFAGSATTPVLLESAAILGLQPISSSPGL
ncbi:hypothetical protein BDR07DRAFT_1502739 [Suillus spraguei]|nr:hypothetical protein BDR07DRAFT_1502739 [Suillus spraguei]